MHLSHHTQKCSICSINYSCAQVHSTTGCDSKTAMHGNLLSQLLHEVPDNCHTVIKIWWHIGSCIIDIQHTYQLSNSQTMVGNYFGGTEGRLSMIDSTSIKERESLPHLVELTHLLGSWRSSLTWEESMDHTEDMPEILSVYWAPMFKEYMEYILATSLMASVSTALL